MKSAFVVLVSAATLFSGRLCATIHIHNRCSFPVQVIRTTDNQHPIVECELGHGDSASCTRVYNRNEGINFRNSYGGKTLAEFDLNGQSQLDIFDLNVDAGFDIAMQITTNNAVPADSVICQSSTCAENGNKHYTRAGGSFSLYFCL